MRAAKALMRAFHIDRADIRRDPPREGQKLARQDRRPLHRVGGAYHRPLDEGFLAVAETSLQPVDIAD